MTWRRPRSITFIRHGQSLRNLVRGDHFALQSADDLRRLGDAYDHDIPLTVEGVRQAQQSGPRIVAELGLPDFIYHSGYVRAVQTTDGLLSGLNPEQVKQIRIRHSIRLRERDPGYVWHMTQTEINQHFPWLDEYHRRVGKLFYRPPGGESIIDVYDGRLYNFLGAIIRDRPGMNVWLVCHGHVMRAARIMMERLTIPQAQVMLEEPVPNVAVTRYVYDKCGTRPTQTHLSQTFWD